MKIIIVGDGKVGATLVEHLSAEGHDVVVIDRDQKIVEQMVNSYDVMGICGNGANCELQLEAGVDSVAPPLEAVVFHFFPIVYRVTPELSVR